MIECAMSREFQWFIRNDDIPLNLRFNQSDLIIIHLMARLICMTLEHFLIEDNELIV